MIPNNLDCFEKERTETTHAKILGSYSEKSFFGKNKYFLYCHIGSGNDKWANIETDLFKHYTNKKKETKKIYAVVSFPFTNIINRGEILAKISKRNIGKVEAICEEF
jgi:hypothetical protein